MLTNDLPVNSGIRGAACCSHSLHREQSTPHCEVVRFRLARGEELRKKKKGGSAGRVPVVNKVNQDANAAAAMHSLQREQTSEGECEGGPPTGLSNCTTDSAIFVTSHKGTQPTKSGARVTPI